MSEGCPKTDQQSWKHSSGEHLSDMAETLRSDLMKTLDRVEHIYNFNSQEAGAEGL